MADLTAADLARLERRLSLFKDVDEHRNEQIQAHGVVDSLGLATDWTVRRDAIRNGLLEVAPALIAAARERDELKRKVITLEHYLLDEGLDPLGALADSLQQPAPESTDATTAASAYPGEPDPEVGP